jgi:anaerobic selenocysteine-containing dehydrogenase
MICWGLGGFGLGLTGALEINTKEDMGANSRFVVMWGANLASQPNTARHLLAARRRGARIVTIDVRETEAAAQADEVMLVRPGSDAALALAMMHVIIGEELYDGAFVAAHTLGFEELCRHVREFTPRWAAGETGIAADRIAALARAYAAEKPAMIVLGGSSLHKGGNGWQAARAVSCLPALVGSYGLAGGGLGPRHAALAHGGGFATVAAAERRAPGRYVPSQMSQIAGALTDGRVRVLLLFGTNMLSSFADAGRVAAAFERLDLVVCHDLFMNETSRHFADVVLPATAWLEDLGCKATQTHLYLTERALRPAGEARPTQDVLRELAGRLRVADFYPWNSQEELIDAILDHPATGGTTVAALRTAGGILPLAVSHVAYPDRRFHTPSGKIEFYSTRAETAGLPPLPVPATERHPRTSGASDYPLTFCQGRTLTQFHAFYDHGQALPTLAERDPGPLLWISTADAARRALGDGDPIRVYNGRGQFTAKAHVTARIPQGVVWMRDGWPGLNSVTSGRAVLPDTALGLFHFTVGQAEYEAMVEVARA